MIALHKTLIARKPLLTTGRVLKWTACIIDVKYLFTWKCCTGKWPLTALSLWCNLEHGRHCMMALRFKDGTLFFKNVRTLQLSFQKTYNQNIFFFCGKQSVITEDITGLFILGLWLEMYPNNPVLKRIIAEVRNLYVWTKELRGTSFGMNSLAPVYWDRLCRITSGFALRTKLIPHRNFYLSLLLFFSIFF